MESFAELLGQLNSSRSGDVAITKSGVSLTFGDLLERSALLGRDLAASLNYSGAEFLPLLLDRTLDSNLAVIACLHQGIPFGLVDGEAPASRISQVLSLFGPATVGWWGPNVHPSVVPRSWVDSRTSRATLSNPRRLDSPAESFVVTTSGTTGQPKGVVITFKALLARVANDVKTDPFNSRQDRVLISFGSPSYSASVKRLVRVFFGYRLHFADPLELGAREILQEIGSSGVTHLTMPPQLARILSKFSNPDSAIFPAVRSLQVGSEGIRFETVQGLRKYLSKTVVFHHSLSSTEGSKAFTFSGTLDELPLTGQVPVGRPEPWVTLVPAPEVAEGVFEVYVSGAIASRYLGDLDDSSRRFTSRVGGRPTWRSQDLVAEGDDGLFYHRGRLDDLVKVRGKLASPSETSRVLQDFAGVRAALTIPTGNTDNIRLVAHVELDANVPPLALWEHLRGLLPSHLVPHEIILHEHLPTTSRGKLDRSQLG